MGRTLGFGCWRLINPKKKQDWRFRRLSKHPTEYSAGVEGSYPKFFCIEGICKQNY
jgi:hypothetical protein